MKSFSGIFNGAFTSLSNSVSTCCGWSEEKPHHHGLEKPFAVLHDQPFTVPPPSYEPQRRARGAESMREQAPRNKDWSGQNSFSVRKRLLSNTPTPSRRPQISAPSNFRHVYSGSFQFPNYGESHLRVRPRSFRPLELSIYLPDQRLSPLLPHFDHSNPPVTPPQRAITHSNHSGDSFPISHERSISSLSFHIPRKPTNTGSVFDSPRSDVVTRPSPARTRAYTSPEGQTAVMDDLIERVANAMLERDRLQEKIEDVIERQSIYVSSRPSTANGIRPNTARSIVEMEPMPDVPALPPDAPSFSERLSFDRPHTAPAKPPTRILYRTRQFSDESTPSPLRRVDNRAPPPPLPLRLRPPLRKKKSFSRVSRVSTWLGFPGDGQHTRDLSLESITNNPMPIHANEGFYQVATPAKRLSFDSDDTVSDWTSSAGDAVEEQTVPTSWSPSSSATVRAVDPPSTVIFGQVPLQHRESVGVAF